MIDENMTPNEIIHLRSALVAYEEVLTTYKEMLRDEHFTIAYATAITRLETTTERVAFAYLLNRCVIPKVTTDVFNISDQAIIACISEVYTRYLHKQE